MKTLKRLSLLFMLISVLLSCTNSTKKAQEISQKAANTRLCYEPISKWIDASDNEKMDACYVFGEHARLKLGVKCSDEQIEKDANELKFYLDSLSNINVDATLNDTSKISELAANFYMIKLLSSYK